MCNNVVLLGRLTKDPEVRYTQSGTAVCSLTLAVNRRFKQEGQQEADFIPVVLWGKTAETAGNYVSKGQRLLVRGRIQTRTYEANDGTKKYVTEIVGEEMEFIEKKADNKSASSSAADSFGHEVFPEEEIIPF